MSGHPRFELLDGRGRAIQVAKPQDNNPAQLATLPAGGKAYFDFQFNTGGAGYDPPLKCPTFHKVRVTISHIPKGFVVADDVESCFRNRLTVTAIYTGPPNN